MCLADLVTHQWFIVVCHCYAFIVLFGGCVWWVVWIGILCDAIASDTIMDWHLLFHVITMCVLC
jgi:hypothetical protein